MILHRLIRRRRVVLVDTTGEWEYLEEYLTVDAGASLRHWAVGLDWEVHPTEVTLHLRLGPVLVVVWWFR